jgi:hypothetical protein
MRRGAPILIAASALALTIGAPASAGTYHVLACSNKGSSSAPIPNNSWTQVPASPPTGTEAFVSCPPQGPGENHDGIVAQDHIPGPPDTPAGSELFWRFTAPAGTRITGLTVTRWLGDNGDQNWTPLGRADGAMFDTCEIPAGQVECESSGDATFTINNAGSIDYGIRCDAPSGTCNTGATLHHAWVSLFAADISLTDPTAPTMSGPSGPLWSSTGYHRGTETATFGGTDNSGILEADWFVDGKQQTQDRGACDFSRPVPCPNMAAATPHAWDMGAFRDGQHQLQAVVRDAAGNASTAGPITITIDKTPPGPPGALAASPAGDGSFTASWTNPDGQTAPITKAHYQFCASGGGACQPDQTASSDNISSITGLHVPGAGSWDLKVWLEDSAGNVGASNAASIQLGHAQTGVLASAQLALAKAKLDGHHRLVVRGKAASDLTDKIAIRYRYRPHRKLRTLGKNAAVHRSAFIAHLKLPAAARRARKGTVTVSYPGDATHSAAKVNQRIRLSRR